MRLPASPVAAPAQGTKNLVDAAVALGSIQHFVLLTSLLTNARAAGQADNPNYKVGDCAVDYMPRACCQCQA